MTLQNKEVKKESPTKTLKLKDGREVLITIAKGKHTMEAQRELGKNMSDEVGLTAVLIAKTCYFIEQDGSHKSMWPKDLEEMSMLDYSNIFMAWSLLNSGKEEDGLENLTMGT